MDANPQTPLVEMKDISLAFGGLKAIDDASIDLYPGEVVGLLGHNGAGKSCLIKVLSGAYKRDTGQIFINGQEATINNPRDAKQYGIETVYQALALADNVDAASNLYLGRELRTRWGTLDDASMEAEARKVMGRLNPNFRRFKEPVIALSGGQRQSVAIARAIHFNARILIMDEPTAALGPAETAQVGELIKQLKAEGIGIFLISHDIHDVFDLADRVTVMKNGQIVGSGRVQDMTKDEVLGMIILGKCPPGAIPGTGSDGELALRHLSRVDNGLRPFVGAFLRQVVARALEDAMLVRAGEFLRVMGGAGVYAVRVPVDGDGRNRDGRLRRERHFNLIVARIAGAGRESVTMPIGMNDHIDEVGIVEGARGSIEGRIVERPLRRPHAPQEARDLLPVLRQAAPPPLAVEVVLIPERRLLGRARRLHCLRNALDVVRIAGDERDDPHRQKSGDDASSSPAPVIPAEHGALDLERVHEVEKVDAESRLLARAGLVWRQKPCWPVAAQIWNNHPRPGPREEWRGLIIGVDVVGKTVAENARPSGRGSIFQVSG